MTTKEIPSEALKDLGLQAGDSLRVLEKTSTTFIVQIAHAEDCIVRVKPRTSAGAWARAARGIAHLDEGETSDDARMDYYRNKFGTH